MKYKAFELHTHTCHSDGQMTTAELLSQGERMLLEGMAITDHNTAAAHHALSMGNISHAMPVIQGMEWTTFWGHLLVMGAAHDGNWRKASPETIGQCLHSLNQGGMALGLAHPSDVGGILRTGANWEYPMESYRDVHYLEVFSNLFPHTRQANALTYRKWTDLLNQGYRLAATSGRDWHRPHEEGQLSAVTYLGIEGSITTYTAVNALRKGCSFVTLGPCLRVSLMKSDQSFSIGDTIPTGKYALSFTSFLDARAAFWQPFSIDITEYRIVHNGKTRITDSTPIFNREVELTQGWVRAEIYGSVQKERDLQLLGFTSPVYIASQS